MRFSVIIPTYNRPAPLSRCLESILKQSLKPAEVLIIDDAALDDQWLSEWRSRLAADKIDLVYRRKNHDSERRGSSESRTIALELAASEIVFIFDDDLILQNEYFSHIMDRWQEHETEENLLGIGGVIINNRARSQAEKIFHRFFGLSSSSIWDINAIGFQSWDDFIPEVAKGYYVHGGASSYRREATRRLGFTAFGGGRTALEDVDFCWRAKNEAYYFLIEPDAKVFHDHQAGVRESDYLIGYKESYNRRLIFKNNSRHSGLNRLRFGWANFGWILRQILSGHFKKAGGMMAGLMSKLIC